MIDGKTPEQIAQELLEKMARDINKDLPPDLWNYVVRISMSKDGLFAEAIPLSEIHRGPPGD